MYTHEEIVAGVRCCSCDQKLFQLNCPWVNHWQMTETVIGYRCENVLLFLLTRNVNFFILDYQLLKCFLRWAGLSTTFTVAYWKKKSIYFISNKIKILINLLLNFSYSLALLICTTWSLVVSWICVKMLRQWLICWPGVATKTPQWQRYLLRSGSKRNKPSVFQENRMEPSQVRIQSYHCHQWHQCYWVVLSDIECASLSDIECASLSDGYVCYYKKPPLLSMEYYIGNGNVELQTLTDSAENSMKIKQSLHSTQAF